MLSVPAVQIGTNQTISCFSCQIQANIDPQFAYNCPRCALANFADFGHVPELTRKTVN